MKKLICVILIFSTIFLCSGCATYSPGLVPSKDLGIYQNKKELDGLTVAVKFLNPEEIRQTFRRNIHKKDVAPAFIVIANRSSNLYRFKKELINQTLLTANEVAERGKFQVFWRALIFSPFTISVLLWPLLLPAIIDGLGAVEANKLMREDYVKKELIDTEIRPQELLAGFLYFDKRCLEVDNNVVVKLSNVDTAKIAIFEFKYNNN